MQQSVARAPDRLRTTSASRAHQHQAARPLAAGEEKKKKLTGSYTKIQPPRRIGPNHGKPRVPAARSRRIGCDEEHLAEPSTGPDARASPAARDASAVEQERSRAERLPGNDDCRRGTDPSPEAAAAAVWKGGGEWDGILGSAVGERECWWVTFFFNRR